MFGRTFPLFRMLGFQIKADTSWIFLVVLIVWSLATGYFPNSAPGHATAVYWQMGAIGAAGLFLSLILHELSHSVVARRYGLPISGITLFLFGGVAEMEEEPDNATVEFLVAVAGPLMSFFLAAFFWIFAGLLVGIGVGSAISIVFGYLAAVNLILAVFNMAPAFPLDGGRMLRAFLWWRRGDFASATRTATAWGQGFGLLLIGLGIFFILSGYVSTGIWQLILGLFLRTAASASLQQMHTKAALSGLPVSRFMTAEPITVDGNLTLEEFVRDYLLGRHHTGFPVVLEEGRPFGYISLRHVKSVPREEWAIRTVAETCDRLGDMNSVPPDMDAHDALALMGRGGRRKLLVIDGGRLHGLLALSDLLEFLSVKSELQV